MCFSLFNFRSNNNHTKSNSRSQTMKPSHGGGGGGPSEPKTLSNSANKKHQHHEFHSFNNLSSQEYSSGTSNKYSSKSSISSRASLSSLKDSLLTENPHIYDIAQIREATNNFFLKPMHSSSSSTSWKCAVDSKDAIVMRRKLRRSIDTAELRDKLMLICKSHHLSLVRLYGASISGNHIYMVYEYAAGANLNECLRNRNNPNFTVLSNWVSRVQIAADVAHGLDYIHNCCGMEFGFVHNHIKSGSIIVSESTFNAKLCHFGTAQLCGEVMEPIDESEANNEIQRSNGLKRAGSGRLKFEGTKGYMSPEYQSTGIPTQKSDVFAFGIVILELLSAQESLKLNIDEESGEFQKVSIIETAREVVADSAGGRLRRWVDWRLKDSYPVEVAERLARVALECVNEDPNRRPDMNLVAGWISKLYLESKSWAESIGVPVDFSVSLAPR